VHVGASGHLEAAGLFEMLVVSHPQDKHYDGEVHDFKFPALEIS
jgi:hypothetical protein